MPLTPKGRKILKSMKKQYGAEKGEGVFYASEKTGTVSGVHRGGAARQGGARGARRVKKH